ncbi:hypothetical protein MOQ72_06105 [Saccharopolyspora sp. K220]|uniref:Clp protease N-terminal domain-containing protein n=1 Tax=Saccharopolyspora soli TaxID=2926618 RepID=UPI001F59E26D|nr:Clp protease N-terminal domain-containing protein [Saccharopolyspora soli]MCI2416990.1 hypothetical protein [Saccharopolyspora soli]
MDCKAGFWWVPRCGRVGPLVYLCCIGPEHILAALLDDPDAAAVQLLDSQEINTDRLRERVERSAAAEGTPVTAPSSDTPTLDEYGRDLTTEARAGMLDLVVGRAEETSNIGAHRILAHEGPVEEIRDALLDDLHAGFAPEFLNRIDEIIIFHRLAQDDLAHIVDLLLDRSKRLLRAQEVDLEITDRAKQWLTKRGYQPRFGARPLRRTIQSELDNRICRLLLGGEVPARRHHRRLGRGRRTDPRPGPPGQRAGAGRWRGSGDGAALTPATRSADPRASEMRELHRHGKDGSRAMRRMIRPERWRGSRSSG